MFVKSLQEEFRHIKNSKNKNGKELSRTIILTASTKEGFEGLARSAHPARRGKNEPRKKSWGGKNLGNIARSLEERKKGSPAELLLSRMCVCEWRPPRPSRPEKSNKARNGAGMRSSKKRRNIFGPGGAKSARNNWEEMAAGVAAIWQPCFGYGVSCEGILFQRIWALHAQAWRYK